MPVLGKIKIENFCSLKKVEVRLNQLNVLVGPNSAGKTNLLSVIKFLGDIVRLDLVPAIEQMGGFKNILFRGARSNNKITIEIEAQVTKFSSSRAVDEYTLSLSQGKINFRPDSGVGIIVRQESFVFKRTKGVGRRITISGTNVSLQRESVKSDHKSEEKKISLGSQSSGLSTLRRLGRDVDAEQINELALLFETFRIFEVNVELARRPSPIYKQNRLNSDAGNLASFLVYLKEDCPETFLELVEDLRYIVPGLEEIELIPVGGASEGVSISLKEKGLSGSTPMSKASFGTVRSIALLAMLHDPAPPKLTCVEEIDHGLHPYALDRIVERLRSASERTQILVATHSPAFVNRLQPSELIVCERNPETGESIIPAIDSEHVREMEAESGLGLGELWFSGTLGGVPH